MGNQSISDARLRMVFWVRRDLPLRTMTPEQLARILQNQCGSDSELDTLDERELEVFSTLAQGYSPYQIQTETGIDPVQLRHIKRRIQAKLGFKDEIQLLRFAAKRGRGE